MVFKSLHCYVGGALVRLCGLTLAQTLLCPVQASHQESTSGEPLPSTDVPPGEARVQGECSVDFGGDPRPSFSKSRL